MNIEQSFKTYLTTCPCGAWTKGAACLLHGAQDMYAATGEEAYADFLKKFGKEALAASAEENRFEKIWKQDFLAALACARSLFFLYEKTGEEAYRNCIERFYHRLKNQPRCACGNFMPDGGGQGRLSLDALSLSQPFYMQYETAYNKKEYYNDVILQFENARRYLYEEQTGLYRGEYEESGAQPKEGFSLRSEGRYLAAIVDVMEHTSIEIYEQYRKLQDIYRQALKGLLRYEGGAGREAGRTIREQPLCSDIPGAQTCALERTGSALTAYSVLKACRSGALLAEKYEPQFKAVVERLLEERPAERPEEVGALMMAYAQCLR